MAAAVRIAPSFHPKVWGSTGLNPWFPTPTEKTGEVWFTSGPHLPLIKFLFTTERLSVQVHPDDAHAQAAGGVHGKTEMWHILRAGPGAQVAIGFRNRPEPEQVRSAALNGTIDGLLNWITVRPGDTLFVPAGTVHAIGAGLALCEIQQHSDITYRLFDYGRNREMHLDQGLAVAAFSPTTGRATLPVRSPHFHAERIAVNGSTPLGPLEVPSALIVLSGDGELEGSPFQEGEVWEVAGGQGVHLHGSAALLRTFVPSAPVKLVD